MAKTIVLALTLTLTIGFAVGALPDYAYPTVWGTVVGVIDGNRITVQIVGSTGGDWIVGSTETVRYLGSYASAVAETPCGAVAAQVNYQMTFGRLVYLEFDQVLRDPDGTLAAYVYLDGIGYSMVNAMLVAMGITKATVEEPNARYASVFLGLEAASIQLRLGCLPLP